MNRRALYIAIGLLVLVNAVVLLGAARNRSGEPDALLTLTERELPLSRMFRYKENSGVSLYLNVNHDGEEPQWFDEGKLNELGFDTRPFREKERRRIYRILPKKAYVVLEYDGEAWQRHRQRKFAEIEELAVKVGRGKLEPEEARKQEEEMRFQLTVASRLFSVDVGPSAGPLRLRYPDRSRYVILPARVRMDIDWREGQERLHGRVLEILAADLHVPRKLQAALETLPGKWRLTPGYTYFDRQDPARAGYQVRMAVGRRHEPWVQGIEALRLPGEAGAD